MSSIKNGFLDKAAALVQQIRHLSPYVKLQRVNILVNENMAYRYDTEAHGGEFWQGPIETLDSGTGDCEDAAIAKIRILMAMDIPMDRLAVDVIAIEKKLSAEEAKQRSWLKSFVLGDKKFSGHAIVNYANSYILDWKPEPVPFSTYYSNFAKSYYSATAISQRDTIQAGLIFPTGCWYDSKIRSLRGVDWARLKRFLASLPVDGAIGP